MVSGVLFYQVHQRLNEIFGCSTVLLFAGLSVLVCGDLYQLPPVKGAPIYCCGTENIKGTPNLELWRRFKIGDTRNLVSVLGKKIGALVMLISQRQISDFLVFSISLW